MALGHRQSRRVTGAGGEIWAARRRKKPCGLQKGLSPLLQPVWEMPENDAGRNAIA